VSTHQGYGNALNVMRAVEELENAGVSGLSIDDTVRPVRGSTKGPKLLISLEEAVGKLKAALAARQDPSLVILGATRALDSGGIPEAIRRVKAYENAGVDAIHLGQGETQESITAIHAETKLPLFIHSRRGLGDQQFLTANGVRIVATPTGNLPLFASMKAQYDILKALRDGKSPAELTSMQASPELRDQVLRKAQYNEWIKKFLT
jgi:carboxyvinyl-carboxyphosphonate phosphorylmutase